MSTLRDWHAGRYLETADEGSLRTAQDDALVLVTYDLRTIPPLLKRWVEQDIPHSGVIFVDLRTIAPTDIGGLIRALLQLVAAHGDAYWRNRVMYLTR